MDEIRLKRVEDELRDLIGAMILDGEIKDPRVGPFVSVTRVEASRDISAARVFVSTFSIPASQAGVEGAGTAAAPAGGEASPAGAPARDSLALAVDGLQSAAGFIQAQVAKRIRLRLTPRLRFIADRGIQEGFELTERIKGLFS